MTNPLPHDLTRFLQEDPTRGNPCFPIPDVGEMSREELEATLFRLVDHLDFAMRHFGTDDRLEGYLRTLMNGGDLRPLLEARRQELSEEDWGAFDGTKAQVTP